MRKRRPPKGERNVRGDIAGLIRKIRPLFDAKTPLADVPRIWLERIEPKITRPKQGACWFWTGSHDHAGEPTGSTFLNKSVGNQRGSIRLKRLIMSWFFDFSRCADVEIAHACGNLSCLNPTHLIVCLDSHKQRDPDELRYVVGVQNISPRKP